MLKNNKYLYNSNKNVCLSNYFCYFYFSNKNFYFQILSYYKLNTIFNISNISIYLKNYIILNFGFNSLLILEFIAKLICNFTLSIGIFKVIFVKSNYKFNFKIKFFFKKLKNYGLIF